MKLHQPDAILTADAALVPMLDQLGYKVPGDVAVAGTSALDVKVTAGVNQNSLEIGKVAAETLVAMINANDRGTPPVPRRILIDGVWQDGPSLPRLAPA